MVSYASKEIMCQSWASAQRSRRVVLLFHKNVFGIGDLGGIVGCSQSKSLFPDSTKISLMTKNNPFVLQPLL